MVAAMAAPAIRRPTATPQEILGSKLVGFVDAEDSTKITNNAGAVEAYADIISAASYAQATAGFRPAIATNAITGRQIFRFDGADDRLEYTGIPTGIPTGANPGEIIAIVTQSALAADTSARAVVAWGGNSALTARRIDRAVSVGVNRCQAIVGNGAAGITIVDPSVDFSGNHLARCVIEATTSRLDVDGIAGTATAVVPSTSTSRFRIGASNNGTANQFWHGDMSVLLFTNAILTAEEFNALAVWGGPRIWG